MKKLFMTVLITMMTAQVLLAEKAQPAKATQAELDDFASGADARLDREIGFFRRMNAVINHLQTWQEIDPNHPDARALGGELCNNLDRARTLPQSNPFVEDGDRAKRLTLREPPEIRHGLIDKLEEVNLQVGKELSGMRQLEAMGFSCPATPSRATAEAETPVPLSEAPVLTGRLGVRSEQTTDPAPTPVVTHDPHAIRRVFVMDPDFNQDFLRLHTCLEPVDTYQDADAVFVVVFPTDILFGKPHYKLVARDGTTLWEHKGTKFGKAVNQALGCQAMGGGE